MNQKTATIQTSECPKCGSLREKQVRLAKNQAGMVVKDGVKCGNCGHLKRQFDRVVKLGE